MEPYRLPSVDLSRYYSRLARDSSLPVVLRGSVQRITGMVIRARMPQAKIGDLCIIRTGRGSSRAKGASMNERSRASDTWAQVVGFDDEEVFLTAFDPLDEIGPKTPVFNHGQTLRVPVGNELLGRVLDSLGKPIDQLGPLNCSRNYPIRNTPPDPLKRRRVNRILPVGIRAVDSLLSIGEGQRLGVFSTAGVGKSSLLGMVARNSTADVNVVALVGERGREVRDFIEDNLGEAGLRKSVVVVSTSDQAPLRRIMAAYSATAIAEYFRDQGLRVMLLMDSVTRFARALREIALSVGEPPARQGYPPSVFAVLPELLERAGTSERGSITALYTVLLSSEQIEDPLGEEIRAILDGHLYLSSRLSHAQHYPAIDILRSNSRVMENLVTDEHRSSAEKLRKLWAVYEENRDLINLGAYKKGSDSDIDEAIAKRPQMLDFLIQRSEDNTVLEDSLARLKKISG